MSNTAKDKAHEMKTDASAKWRPGNRKKLVNDAAYAQNKEMKGTRTDTTMIVGLAFALIKRLR